MSFRDNFIKRVLNRTVTPKRVLHLTQHDVEAFKRRDLEMAIQLHMHLKHLNATIEDVIALIADLRVKEQRRRMTDFSRSALRTRASTREEQKHETALARNRVKRSTKKAKRPTEKVKRSKRSK